MMEGIDISTLSICMAVILLLIYIIPSFHTEDFLIPRKKRFGESKSKQEALQPDNPVLQQVSQYTASWWSDNNIYQLERRAIFSKTWLWVTHVSRFQKAGDYRTFDIAGFSFILILGKDGRIRAFHNMCRHRAYAVTKKESGSSTVLGCRYHGWSYDTKGKLIKAPEFEGVQGFSKDMNGLWELQTEVIDAMVFVNFYSNDERIPLEVSGGRLKLLKTEEMEWKSGWKFEGAFNWKLAVGELSPDRGNETEQQSLWQSTLAIFQKNQETEWKMGCNTIIRQLPSGQLLTIKLLPKSAVVTTFQCDLYASRVRSSRAEQKYRNYLKDLILFEVKKLEIKQEELLAGFGKVVDAGQDEISGLLKAHLAAERDLGHEIHPAARKQTFTADRKADDDFCAELDNDLVCNVNRNGLLDW